MAWAFVQAPAAVNEDNGDGTLAVTFGSNVTSGNRIVIAILMQETFASVGVTSVTDSLGNTYTQDVLQTIRDDGTFTEKVAVYSAPVTTGGSCTITVVLTSGSPNRQTLAAAEYSGIGAVDVSASAAATSSSAINSGNTGATAAANELVVGVIAVTSSGVDSDANPSGYTQRAEFGATFASVLYLGDKDSGSGGSTPNVADTWGEAANWGAAAIVYSLTGGAPGGGGSPSYGFSEGPRPAPFKPGLRAPFQVGIRKG